MRALRRLAAAARAISSRLVRRRHPLDRLERMVCRCPADYRVFSECFEGLRFVGVTASTLTTTADEAMAALARANPVPEPLPEDPGQWRMLTVRPMWSWAIAHGGKGVKNRTWPTEHRGWVLVHSGQAVDEWSIHDERVRQAWARFRRLPGTPERVSLADAVEWRGRVVAVAYLADCHEAREGCCGSRWGERWQDDAGMRRRPVFHWVLTRVRPVPGVVEAKGGLGLRRVDHGLLRGVLGTLGQANPHG